MAQLGLPVPPGFTITTEVCTYFSQVSKTYPKELKAQVDPTCRRSRPHHREDIRRRRKSAPRCVRARASMPGMMDTVLNLGLDQRDRGARGEVGNRACAPTGASSPCIRTWCSASSIITSRKFSTTTRTATPTPSTPRRRRLGADHRPLRSTSRRKPGPDSAGPPRAIVGRDRRRIRFVDEPARHHLSPAATPFRKAGARPSTCRPWCSATWARRRRPASPSPAILQPARRKTTANSSSTRRAEDVVAGIRTPPGCAPNKRARNPAPTSRRWKRRCRTRCLQSSNVSIPCWKTTTATCKIWNSQ